MKLKSLTLALVSAGVLATGTASAIGWNPSDWFGKRPVASNVQPVAVQAQDAPPSSSQATPLAGMAAPNYRAIVERYGPAVVGINTEGTIKASAADLPDELANDPFFRFFQGIPGLQGRAPR